MPNKSIPESKITVDPIQSGIGKKGRLNGALWEPMDHFEEPYQAFDPLHLSSSVNAIHTLQHKISTFGGILDDKWRARLLIVIAAALYGTNFTMVKILDENMPVGISTTLRFALSAAVTLPWLLAPALKETDSTSSITSPTSDVHESRDLMKALSPAIAGMEVGMWNSVGYLSQAIGLTTTLASKSAFICSLAVVIVPFLNFLAGKKMLPREALGALMAVMGVGLLEMDGSDIMHSLEFGDIASLVQPFAFGFGFWRMEAAMRNYPNEAKRLTAGQLFSIFVASAAYCVISGGGSSGFPNISEIISLVSYPLVYGALLWTGIVTTALTIYFETVSKRILDFDQLFIFSRDLGA